MLISPLLAVFVLLTPSSPSDCCVMSRSPNPNPPHPTSASPDGLHAWWLAIRPYSLPITLCPVLLGGVLAWLEGGQWHPVLWLVCLLAGWCIQIGTNLLNDVGDYERGTDTPDRLGTPRATSSGWLPAHQVRRAGLGALALAAILGLVLVGYGGWPIVCMGVVALLCGWAYTAGAHPIAYGPLGEVCVWIFFGLAATVGTYWILVGQTSTTSWAIGHSMGAFAAAVMLINNLRDATTDARAGKRTLAVYLGLRAGRWLYTLWLLLPWLLLTLHAIAPAAPAVIPGFRARPLAYMHLLPIWLLLIPALRLIYQIWNTPPSHHYNRLLARTAQLQLAFTLAWLLHYAVP